MTVLAVITVAAAQGQSPRELFERARLLEKANPASAEVMKLYEQVAATAKGDRALTAQALLGLARAQERAAKPEARATYERVVGEYADQVTAATTARTALTTLPSAPGAPATSRPVGRFLRGEAITASAVAPDGKSAVLAVQIGGGPATTYSLVRRDLQTGADRTLTRLRNAAQSVRFAPGGRYVAVVILSSTAETIQEELVVVDVDASVLSPIVLPGITLARADFAKFEATDNPWMVRLAWSPDGEALAYVVPGPAPRSFDCRLLNVATRETRSLGVSVEAKPDFRWSSQGVLAIHVTEGSTGTDVIRLITPASNQTRVIPVPKGPDFSTWLGQWTESGSIAIVQDRPAAAPEKGRASVFLLNLETGQLTATCAGNGPYRMEGKPVFWINRGGGPDQCLQITRDGKSQIIWKSASKKLIVRDVQTGVDRNLTIGSGEEDYGILTPDHRAIVFVSDRDGEWGLYAAPLTTVPSENPVLLTKLDDLPRSLDLQWTTDGMVAAWTVLRRNIWRLEVDREKGRATGSAERLTQESPQNFIPSISPNGRQIAYYSIRGARNGLAVMNADGSGERFVREFQFVSPTFPPKPAWRTNDEVIVAAPLLGDLSGPIEISTVDIRSGVATKRIPRLMTNGFDGEYLVKTDEVVYAWKEDSAVAGVQAAGWTELRATSLANGDTRTLVRFGAADGRITSLRLSPDGHRVAYLLVKDPGNRNSGEFGVLSLQDGSRRVLASNRSVTAGAGIVAWSPDGRFIHYNQGVPRVFDTAAGVSQDAPAAGQASWPLAAPGQAVDWMAGAGSWSPDGSFIVVTQSDGGEEVRQWHGLTIAAITQRSPIRR
jgi:Tol biopolymer transport system component